MLIAAASSVLLRGLPRLASRRPPGRRRLPCCWRCCRCATARSPGRTRCLRRPASASCCSIPGRCSISAPGSRPAPSGARSRLAAGAIGRSARPGAGGCCSFVGRRHPGHRADHRRRLRDGGARGIVLNFLAIPLAAVAVPGVLASLLARRSGIRSRAALAAGRGSPSSADLLAALGRALPWAPVSGARRVALGLAVARGFSPCGSGECWAAPRHGEALRGAWACARGCAGLGGRPSRRSTTRAVTTPSISRYIFSTSGRAMRPLLRTPGGHWVVMDAGPRDRTVGCGPRVVAPFLPRHGADGVDVLVVSHAHADHLGGVPALLDRYSPRLMLEPGEPVARSVVSRVARPRSRPDRSHGVRGRPGDRFEVDGVRFSVLHPDTGWSALARGSERGFAGAAGGVRGVRRRCSPATRVSSPNRCWRVAWAGGSAQGGASRQPRPRAETPGSGTGSAQGRGRERGQRQPVRPPGAGNAASGCGAHQRTIWRTDRGGDGRRRHRRTARMTIEVAAGRSRRHAVRRDRAACTASAEVSC